MEEKNIPKVEEMSVPKVEEKKGLDVEEVEEEKYDDDFDDFGDVEAL